MVLGVWDNENKALAFEQQRHYPPTLILGRGKKADAIAALAQKFSPDDRTSIVAAITEMKRIYGELEAHIRLGFCVGLKEAFRLEEFSEAKLLDEKEPRTKNAALELLGAGCLGNTPPRQVRVAAHVLSALSCLVGSVGRALLAGFRSKPAVRGKKKGRGSADTKEKSKNGGIAAADSALLQKQMNSSGAGRGVGKGISICNSPVAVCLVINVLR